MQIVAREIQIHVLYLHKVFLRRIVMDFIELRNDISRKMGLL